MQKYNCIIVDDEFIARDIIKNHLKNIESINLVASCKNAIEAFNEISSNNIDLIFLDINMPDISGISFAKSINKDLKIIFTTAYREYAIDGFDLKAVDYLLKPISLPRFLQAVNKFISEKAIANPVASNKAENDYFFVRSDRKMVKIIFADINYIESLSDYLKIHSSTGTIITRETITNIELKLPKKDFIRTHRSFIVSVAKIDSFTNEYVEINDKAVPISRSYKKDVLMQLGD
ncbi:MAG: response regulator transcription factor [Bacteroidota bacterium]|nr:response regulator transcription factor [Bacteroidota bacterium]